jgi:hypothetical protein
MSRVDGVTESTQFLLVDGWEQLPDGWTHPDVVGITIAEGDRVLVFSRSDHPMALYGPDGRLEAHWGEGVFDDPHMARFDSDGHVWTVDKGDHTVRKFTLDGTLLMTVGGDRKHGVADREVTNYREVNEGGPPFNLPTDVCVMSDGTFYVTDGYGNARVHRFSADGTLEHSWGEPGVGPGQFNLPHNIVCSPDESRLYVGDRENSRIQIFDRDGAFVEEWRDIARPCGLWVTDRGEIYVAELGERAGRFPWMAPIDEQSPFSRCTVRDDEGRLLAAWGTADAVAPGSFYAAHTIAVDSQGDVYAGEVAWSAGGNRGEVPADCHTLQKFTRR